MDVYIPDRTISIDTTFWQHRSIFAGTQEQLDQLRREADARAHERADAYAHTRAGAAAHPHAREYAHAQRQQTTTFDTHRPAIRRLTPVLHVGFIPMLWAITTCNCGDRWPCNTAKQHLRAIHGWTTDITPELNAITRQLPPPRTRLTRLRRLFTRRRGSRRHPQPHSRRQPSRRSDLTPPKRR